MGTAAAEQIEQGCLRRDFLDDFLRCLENPAGFPTVTHKPGGWRLTFTINKRVGSFCSIEAGSFYVVKRKLHTSIENVGANLED